MSPTYGTSPALRNVDHTEKDTMLERYRVETAEHEGESGGAPTGHRIGSATAGRLDALGSAVGESI